MDSARFDFDRDFMLAVHGMKVRDAMLTVEHADYDSEESGELRQLDS